MTEPGDHLSRRYRELPREEPPAHLDSAILAASRAALAPKARARSQWMVPESIAAVLVLGIGVSLRMQLEQRGQLQQRTQIEVFEQPADQEELRKRERARQFLEKKKAEALQKRAAKQAQRRVQPLPDAADMSSEETVVSLEGKDYDNEAEAIIARRRAAAERQVRDESSQEELSTLQRARREARQDVTIGSQAEHDEWHAQLAAGAPEDATRRGANPLARFTDGSLRSALILGEILGRPRGERSQDG